MNTINFKRNENFKDVFNQITDYIISMLAFILRPVAQLIYDRYRKFKSYSIRKQNRIKKEIRRKFFILSISCVLGVIIAFTANVFIKDVNAEENEILHKYYTFYTVEPGDSLWEVADAHYELGYDNHSDYIDEVMFINHLKDADDIVSGDTLVLPYYSYEIK